MNITRKINWINSKDPKNLHLMNGLEKDLQAFYSLNPDYYSNINFTEGNWIDEEQKGYQAIIAAANSSVSICEVGCGSANILNHYPHFISKYSGCDFSDVLMQKNCTAYSGATFTAIQQPNLLPFEDEQFDLVFSTFVLEHSTNPSLFLSECSRILKLGGTLIILCPDFLAKGRLTSQRSGFGAGTTSQKIKQGKYFDALVTLWDNRIRIPLVCKSYQQKANKEPSFFINLNPTLFQDTFIPDVDAVYVTYKNEIINELSNSFTVKKNSSDLSDYENKHQLIFIAFTKELSTIIS
jgi:SAM-dependent methyltransferase